MNNSELKDNLEFQELLFEITEGNPGAVKVYAEMMSDERLVHYISLLKHLDIKGARLYILYNDCCDRNNDKLFRTLLMFRYQIFSKAEISANLDQAYVIPFIDDNIIIDGMPSYEENFSRYDLKWFEFCIIQKKAFLTKMESVIKSNDAVKKGR